MVAAALLARLPTSARAFAAAALLPGTLPALLGLLAALALTRLLTLTLPRALTVFARSPATGTLLPFLFAPAGTRASPVGVMLCSHAGGLLKLFAKIFQTA